MTAALLLLAFVPMTYFTLAWASKQPLQVRLEPVVQREGRKFLPMKLVNTSAFPVFLETANVWDAQDRFVLADGQVGSSELVCIKPGDSYSVYFLLHRNAPDWSIIASCPAKYWWRPPGHETCNDLLGHVTDHLPEAWREYSPYIPIRETDVEASNEAYRGSP